jgi:KaiC/GvpD/RAD55 family RecA-like ATPase
MRMSKKNEDTSAKLDISRENFDGFRFVFGGVGLDLANGGSTVLIEGQAGVGKTVLALQMATSYLNTCDKSKEYVLYIAFEQPADSLEVLLNSFDFFGFRSTTEICKCPPEIELHKLPPGKLHILSRPPSSQKLSKFIDYITQALSEFKECAMLVLDSIGVFESPQNPEEREELDRLCNGARRGGYALTMVREKEPRAAEAVAEYVTDTVFELQFKPMNLTLPYGPLVRTIEVKKSRVQKSDRGPHEFEIIDGLGIVVYPSCASVFQRVYEDKLRVTAKEEESIEVFDCKGGESLDKDLTHDVDMPG